MPFARRKQAAQIAQLHDQLSLLATELERTVTEKDLLSARLRDLEQRLGTTEAERAADQARLAARLDEIAATVLHQLQELDGELAAATQRLAGDVAQGRTSLAALESGHASRLTAIEQSLDKLTSTGVASHDDIQSLRARQAELANELVRYELALRRDLAHIVEQLSVAARRRPA